MTTTPSFVRTASAVVLACSVLSAQEVQQAVDAIDLGVYDLITKTFTGTLTADSGAAEVLFDNTTLASAGYDTLVVDEVDLGWLATPLDITEPTIITSLTFGYITRAFSTTSFTFNLHTDADEGVPGTSRAFIFENMPASDGEDPIAYKFTINLADPESDAAPENDPLLITNGMLGVSMQVDDFLTGPAWADVTAEENPFSPGIDVYDVDTQYLFTRQFDEEEIPSPILGVSGTAQRLVVSERVPVLIERGRDLEASLIDEPDIRVRFEGLEDERMTVLVRRVKGSLLRPLVDIVDLATDEVIGTAGKGGGKARTRLTLPRTGLYELRITSADGAAGTFTASLRGRPPRAARRPTEPEAPIDGEPPKVVFPGRGAGLLSATIEPSEETTLALLPPVLRTDIGDLDLSAYMTQIGNEFEITDFPLPAVGGYQLFGGAVVDDPELMFEQVPQKIKARIRFEKFKKANRKTVALEDRDLVGHWVRSDFVTEENVSRYTFDLDRLSGRSQLVVVDGEAVTTYRIGEWRIKPSVSGLPGARVLEIDVDEVEIVTNTFTSVTDGAFEVLEYFHPDGDPDRIQFVDSGIVWRRPTTELPPVTSMSDPGVTVSDGEFGVPSGLPVFTIECPPEARWFEIYRTESPGDRPSAPRDVVQATCTGASTSTRRYIDYDADPGVTYRYWVRVLDAEGRRGPTSEPLDVAPEVEED